MEDSTTILHNAVRQDNAEKVRDILRSENCNINTPNKEGKTALHILASYVPPLTFNQKPTFDHNDVKWDLLLRDPDTKTIVKRAIIDAYSSVANILLSDKRCDVNAVDGSGETALHIAVNAHSSVRYKLPTAFTREPGWKVIRIIHKRFTILTQLLSHPSIDLNIQGLLGRTALHDAVRDGNSHAVHKLIKDTRCDVTIQDVDGQTAVHRAAIEFPQSSDIYESCLLEYILQSERASSALTVLDNMGESVVSLFIRNLGVLRHYKEVPCIPDFFLQALTPEYVNAAKHTLSLAVEISSTNVCKQLLDKGADISSTTVHDEPPLFCAIRLNSLPKCKLLLEYDANLTTSWNGMSPLQYAIATSCKPEILELISKDNTLVEIQQDLQTHAIANETPLTASVRLRVLPWIKHFATEENICVPDGTGRSALELACRDRFIYRCVSSLCGETIPNSMKCRVEEMKQWYDFVKQCETTVKSSNRKGACGIPNCIKNPCLSSFESDVKTETDEITKYIRHLLMVISEVMDNEKDMKHLAFHPVFAGSMSEATKTFMPNEFDVMCRLKNQAGYTTDHPSSLDCRLIAKEKHSPFHSMTLKDWIQPKQLAAAFYSYVGYALRQILTQRKDMGNLHIPEHCLCLKEKISCLQLLWRGKVFKDMMIHVDLAPTLDVTEEAKVSITRSLRQPFPLVGDYRDMEIIAKQPRHGGTPDLHFHVSFSQTETVFFQALPANVKTGFVFAKAMRINAICNLAQLFQSDEMVNTEDYITTFMLKQTLLRSLFHFTGQPPIDFTDMTPYEVADTLYAEIENGVMTRSVKSFYFGEIVQCHCMDPRFKKGCCFKMDAILVMCQHIRKWIAAKHMVYSRR